MDGISGWAKNLYDTSGINLTILYDGFDRSRFLLGLYNTLLLVGICIVFSLIIGVVGAWVQGSKHKLLRTGVNGYIQLFRNTPSLIQLYFFYFALGPLLTVQVAGAKVPLVSNFTWAAVCFSIYAGAFNVEIFRSGIEAVPKETVEAAESLGYSRLKAYAYVILPLAFRISLPALNNNLVNLIKQTSIAYAIAVPELLYVSSQIWSDAINVPEMMNVLLVSYVSLVSVFVFVMARVERRLRVPGLGM
jgi:polar amino acid transport system permease protein